MAVKFFLDNIKSTVMKDFQNGIYENDGKVNNYSNSCNQQLASDFKKSANIAKDCQQLDFSHAYWLNY